MTQQLNNASTGTAGTVQPLTSYAVNLALKVDVVPAAGVLTIDLIDGNSNVIQDAQGNNNSFAVTLSGATTSWVFHSGVFRMPRALPAAMFLRIRLSTGLSSGSNLFIDHLAMGALTRLYNGGPGASDLQRQREFHLRRRLGHDHDQRLRRQQQSGHVSVAVREVVWNAVAGAAAAQCCFFSEHR